MDLSRNKRDSDKECKFPSPPLAGPSTAKTRSFEASDTPLQFFNEVNSSDQVDFTNEKGATAITNTSTSTSWLEQIQFTAQYNHYRTNNYASVVNSSSSLDKVDTVKIPGDRMRIEASGSGCGTPTEKRGRNSLCWHFPRVKLRQIFNAKSLEDILGRNLSPSTSGGVKLLTKSGNRNTKKLQGQGCEAPSISNSHSSLSSESGGILRHPHLPKIQYHCEITPPSPKITLSTSSSDNTFCASKNTLLAVPIQEVGKRQHRPHRPPRPRAHSQPRVTTTKSDDCINRITVKCGTAGRKLSNPCPNSCESNSVNDLDVLESVYTPTIGVEATSTETLVPGLNRGKKIRFVNRVTPVYYSPDNDEMASMSSENRPRLVVASVSFLQRPVSPLPSGWLSSSENYSADNKISQNVFNQLSSSQSRESSSSTAPPRNGTGIGGMTRTPSNENSHGLDGRTGGSLQNDDNNTTRTLYSHLHHVGRPNPEQINSSNFQCCGLFSSDKNNTRGLEDRPQAQQLVPAQGKPAQDKYRSGHDSAPPSSFASSKNHPGSQAPNKNLSGRENIEADKTERGKYLRDNPDLHEMGDLQSPQYVKRTAHMFNSRYASSTPSQNGASDASEGQKILPSYLSVSKSISGYSCLSYNGSSNGCHGSNGIPNRSAVPFQPRQYNSRSNGTNHSHNNGTTYNSAESDHFKYKSSLKSTMFKYDGDGPPAPPLPTSAPPLSSPGLVSGKVISDHENIPELLPSTGREKSPFILNRIERLCGSTEVMSSWKRRGQSASPDPSSQRRQEKIIPITLEEDDQNASNLRLKATPGNHNLRQTETKTKDTRDSSGGGMEIRDDDKVDGENSRTIPLHLNVNFKDVIDMSSSNNLNEVSEAGVVPFQGKPAHSKVDSKSSLSDPRQSEPSPVGLATMAENPATGQIHHTSKRAPLTEVAPANKESTSSLDSRVLASLKKESTDALILSGEKDGNYFLLEMNSAKNRLDDRIADATEHLNKLDSSSDEAGRIRAAIGKANLLCSKKFKQFRELCQTNLEESLRGATSDEPFTTKNDDLAGFWDMVLIQVEQVHSMFDDLDPNHKPAKPNPTVPSARGAMTKRLDQSKTVSPKTSSTTSVKQKSESATARDEMRRKVLAEKRRAMKNQAADTSGSKSEAEVHIFAPGSN